MHNFSVYQLHPASEHCSLQESQQAWEFQTQEEKRSIHDWVAREGEVAQEHRKEFGRGIEIDFVRKQFLRVFFLLDDEEEESSEEGGEEETAGEDN